MNERIKELISQAEIEVWGNDLDDGAPEFEGYKLDPAKFAELMIQECKSAMYASYSSYSNGQFMCIEGCYKAINDHFKEVACNINDQPQYQMNSTTNNSTTTGNNMTDAFSRMVTALIANEVKLSPNAGEVCQMKEKSK